MRYLVTNYRSGADFVIGLLKLRHENPGFMEDTMQALRGSDLCLYGTCSGFVRDAADVLGNPCVRYFYSPYDRTDQYLPYSTEHGTPGVAKSYDNITDGMVVISNLLLGRWRREHGLPKVKTFDHYLTQNGRPVLTLVIPLALDQYYYGRTIHELGLGPAPLYIRNKLCSQEALEEALRDLVSGRYDAQAKISRRRSGRRTASARRQPSWRRPLRKHRESSLQQGPRQRGGQFCFAAGLFQQSALCDPSQNPSQNA